MDIDFPLLLTWAVLVTGAIWLFDVLVMKPRRERAASEYLARHPDASLDDEGVQALRRRPTVVEYAWSFFPVLLLVLILRSFLFEPYQIPSPSMVPTLETGDFIVVNKYAYGLRLPVLGTKIVEIGAPIRGDVMVFVPPHVSKYYIKRVIGIPGDHVQIRNKRLFINGELVPIRFVDQVTDARGDPVRVYEEELDGRRYRIFLNPGRRGGEPEEWRLGADEYLMLGDNRDNSEDSREWGLVPEANIVGRATAIWMHKEPGLNWPSFQRNGRIE
jgi:signal peptidase I